LHHRVRGAAFDDDQSSVAEFADGRDVPERLAADDGRCAERSLGNRALRVRDAPENGEARRREDVFSHRGIVAARSPPRNGARTTHLPSDCIFPPQ
jgi:hypothetical protein